MTDNPNTVQAERARSRIAMTWDSDVAHAFRRSPVAMISFAVTLILILSAVFAPLIAPHDPFNPATLNLMNGFTPPGQANMFTGDTFLLGTDDQGRDVFSTILYGLRISLFVGFAAVGFAMVLGITLGLIAGYVGGLVETIIMSYQKVRCCSMLLLGFLVLLPSTFSSILTRKTGFGGYNQCSLFDSVLVVLTLSPVLSAPVLSTVMRRRHKIRKEWPRW
jgi:ABC-type dipeptide/oligopeptide/nickel transport system permease subunit